MCVTAAAVLPASLMLYGVSVPGGYYDFLVGALWCWAIVGVAWAVVGMRWLLRDPPESRWRLWPLAVFPVLLVATWWTASGDLIGKAAFAHYRADLERLAGRPPTHDDTHVGPYTFDYRIQLAGCTLFSVRGPAMAQGSGFAWCPGVAPIDHSWGEGEIFERIEGDWYTFVMPFGGDRVDPWGLQVTRIDSVGHV
ncbi:hypothetical protein [Phytohabitans suffuscus]|uniref:Uncharacterized protein n=1 Tax=Phytohabitans suffuscus TaxID=624315 RepID=A0A6F8Z0Y5_9ACTN|nr:hypothetical protein [Phytohabitans suffuscus]BCB92100.1 hypothetical protein Psuf_094130 [Phytohabitans suffuscus]